MKQIPLTQGKFALVDDNDYEELSQCNWCAAWNCHTRSFYAQRHSSSVNGKRTIILMHRVILGAKSGQESDHRNHDTLDNRRENLRLCTHNENQHNQKPQMGSSSFKGISWHKLTHKWRAQIQFNASRHHLGCFTDELDAARAYDTAARILFGEFALTNFGENP
jgi:hypothetical protein